MAPIAPAHTLKIGLRRQLPYLGPVLLWMAVIAVLSTDVGSSGRTTVPLIQAVHRLFVPRRNLTPAELELLSHVARKSAHLLEYAILGLLTARWLLSCFPAPRARLILIAIAVAACYAASDELHQRLVPSRTSAVGDVLFDLAGASAGAVAFGLRRGRQGSLG